MTHLNKHDDLHINLINIESASFINDKAITYINRSQTNINITFTTVRAPFDFSNSLSLTWHIESYYQENFIKIA